MARPSRLTGLIQVVYGRSGIDEPGRPSSRPSRHPYQVWSLGMLALAGAVTILAPQPGAVSTLLPDWQRALWAGLLVISAVIALIGAYWQRPATGWLLERAGHAGLAGGALAYAVALVAVNGATGIPVGLILLGLHRAAVRRVIDITHDLDNLEHIAPGPDSPYLNGTG